MLKISKEVKDMFQFNEYRIRHNPHQCLPRGNGFACMRNQKYYQDVLGMKTFTEYCRRRWGISRRHANRLIAAAKVASNLEPMGVVPFMERHARPLTALSPGKQREAWSIALNAAKNGMMTAKTVTEAVKRLLRYNPYSCTPAPPLTRPEKDEMEFAMLSRISPRLKKLQIGQPTVSHA